MLVLEQLLQSLVVASQDDHRMALLPVAGLVARTHPVAASGRKWTGPVVPVISGAF